MKGLVCRMWVVKQYHLFWDENQIKGNSFKSSYNSSSKSQTSEQNIKRTSLKFHDTVDGRNLKQPPVGCIVPCKWWDKLLVSTSTGECRLSEPSTVCCSTLGCLWNTPAMVLAWFHHLCIPDWWLIGWRQRGPVVRDQWWWQLLMKDQKRWTLKSNVLVICSLEN